MVATGPENRGNGQALLRVRFLRPPPSSRNIVMTHRARRMAYIAAARYAAHPTPRNRRAAETWRVLSERVASDMVSAELEEIVRRPAVRRLALV